MNLCPKTIHVVGSQKGKGGGGGGWLIPHSRSFSREYCVPNFHHRHPTDRFLSQSRIRTQILANPASRVAVKSRTQLKASRIPHCILFKSRNQEIPFQTRCYSDMGIRVLGIPIPKSLGIWASPSFINLAMWLKVRVTGDAHITRGFGNGDAQNAGTLISQ